MKRKIFTLVVALLALAGFQANAQVVVGIQTGQATPPSEQPNTGAGNFTNERGGYAGKVVNVPNKLTFNGTNFVVATNATPNTKANSPDLITVSNPSANFIVFQSANGTTLSLKDPGGVSQSQFVVFRGTYDTYHVPDYYNAGVATSLGNPGQVIAPQLLNGGVFEGFVAIQAGGMVDDPNLLIVVHDSQGNLSLMAYKDYVTSLNGDLTKAANKYYPLYVKTLQRAGHWATPTDFKDCKFNQFLYNGAALNLGGETTFSVKQVDYVQNALAGAPTSHNIIGSPNLPAAGGTFEGMRNYTYYGTTPLTGSGAATDSVIPLFVLASPSNSCKVLSVSRSNDLVTQSQQDGGYANKLELRAYGTYWGKKADGTWAWLSYTANDAAYYDKYTSLQKFAVWVDDDGYMTLYPAASYFWKYGEDKTKQADNILANAVLLYNNIGVSYAAGSGANVNKSYGIQIGYWNGNLSGQNTGVTGYIGTSPNVIQTNSDYQARKLGLGCAEVSSDLSGRFYFLQVRPDTTGLWALDHANNPTAVVNANAKNGYQWIHSNYVLSTQIWSNDSKSLAMVPEEINRGSAEYWLFPYDSVNMAAHWEIKAVDKNDLSQGYIFINMLGDTLQYSSTDNYALAGGYLPINGLIPGDPAAQPWTDQKYFGRPEVEGTDPAQWFDPNSIAPTAICSAWKVHQLKGQSTFYLEPACTGVNSSLALSATGWYNASYHVPYPLDYYNAMKNAANGYSYYQQDVVLQPNAVSGNLLESYGDNNFSACGGLAISLKEIDYVPTYGIPNQPLYPGEPINTVINTNDKDFMKQDSLTAYTFLEGNYDLREARAVDNGLRLNSVKININDGKGTMVDVARLDSTPGSKVLQFIPVNSPTGKQRTANIRKFSAIMDNGIDTLYGETYKWYLVKNNATGKYMTFDTVNVTAATNRQKVGFVFTADLTNATPVRLYQPLVGDKNIGNFLIQFYMPLYTYVYNADGTPNMDLSYINTYPNIEGPNSDTQAINGGGEVCFATLVSQSNYIYGTRAYNGSVAGTRFTVLGKETVLECVPQFIDQQWMGANRLLSLPLNNQAWVGNNAVSAWIATGATDGTAPNTRSIISNDTSKIPATTLTHTYVTRIRVYNGETGALATYNETTSGQGIAKVAIPHNVYNLSPAKGDTTWVGSQLTATLSTSHDQNQTGTDGFAWGFNNGVDVPLYYVQNDQGLYLTVIDNTEMRSQGTTPSDVSSIRLGWRPLYQWDTATKSIYDNYGFDRQALQLFAISGCQEKDSNGWYGKFIYLPLASYKVADYNDGSIVQTVSAKDTQINDVFYNWNLGKGSALGGNDVTSSWRISQWAPVQFPTKDLVVMSANSATNVGLTPVEFKLSKMNYLKPGCDYQLVQETGTSSANKGKFATFDKDAWLAKADANTIAAHWAIDYTSDKNDPLLAKFVPELQKMYGVTVVPTNLTGQYYFIKQLAAKGDTVQYKVIDVSGYTTGNYAATFDTLSLVCTTHAFPFFDLEADGGFNIDAVKLAILETPFLDRNLTDQVTGEKTTPIYRYGKLIGYQTYLNQLAKTANFKDAKYLNVYRENVRDLAPNTADTKHIIPYYSFSLADSAGTEYFLNVDSWSGQDSVYWTKITTADSLARLLDWENNPNFMSRYKFCLPYKLNADGSRAAKVAYGDTSYPPVYIQTLDTARVDYPYLVVAGSATKYVTARKLDDALLPAYKTADLSWNIYTVNYADIDSVKVTSWIFGGPTSVGDVWVPIADIIGKGNANKTTKEGQLTDQKLGQGGISFITESGMSPNYGTFTGINDAPVLTLHFEGDTTIGAYAVRQIWYYRISLDSAKYLTDATGDATVPTYAFNGNNYHLGYFTTLKANEPTYVSDGIYADKGFVQAFGFRYVTDSSDPNQAFYIVSNANYTSPKNVVETGYRYLAQVNNHLVFVGGTNNAMVFQWGKAADGSYTNLELVGQGNIYGVQGGVRVMNTTGKVDVYSIDGRLIKSIVLSGSDQTIPAPKGIAIVKAGSEVVKVVVQ